MSDGVLIALIGAVSSVLTCLISALTGVAVKSVKVANRDLMRNEITKLYYANKDTRTLKEYERESLDKMVAGYKQLGGNSYVQDLYDTMRKWEVER